MHRVVDSQQSSSCICPHHERCKADEGRDGLPVFALQVDTQREVVLVPIYGVMVPFHILTIKNATNNQARIPPALTYVQMYLMR